MVEAFAVGLLFFPLIQCQHIRNSKRQTDLTFESGNCFKFFEGIFRVVDCEWHSGDMTRLFQSAAAHAAETFYSKSNVEAIFDERGIPI